MSRTAKRILTALLLLVAAGLLFYAFRPKPLVVETACASRGPLEVTIDEDGQTRAHDRFTLTAPVNGMLSRITLHEGDAVKANAVIAAIHPLPVDPREEAETRARIASAMAQRSEAEQLAARAEADHQQAERDLARAESLLKQGILPRERFEDIESHETVLRKEVEAAKERVKAANAEVKRAESGLISMVPERTNKGASTPIRVPVDGRVLRILEQSERVVTSGTPIAVLSNTTKIEVVADLLSTDAVKVQPGAAVWIENWGGDKRLRAVVRTVEPYGFTKVSALGIEEQRVNVIADFTDPPTGLGDGFKVDVRIVTWDASDVLTVPSSALFRVGEFWSVFVVEGKVAQLRRVEIGHRNPQSAEVISGLTEGEEVVLHPPNDLKDGALVNAVSRD